MSISDLKRKFFLLELGLGSSSLPTQELAKKFYKLKLGL